MYSFFGHYETEKELDTAMINTFRTNPDKYLKALAQRIIAQEMQCVTDANGVTVFVDEALRNKNNN
jgi:hypothetical protein